MNVDMSVICLFLGVFITLQGWTLREVTRIKTRVAILATVINERRKTNETGKTTNSIPDSISGFDD